LERSDNHGVDHFNLRLTLKGFAARGTLAGFLLASAYFDNPGLSLHSNPGLKLANAFGVISN
jgi:hypothetical protein